MNAMDSNTRTREFKGKRALVTGGTRGIGAAIVHRLLDTGAEVLTTARSATHTGPQGAAFVAADVRTRAGSESIATAVRETLGAVDFVIHNAGGAQPYDSALSMTDEVWQDALELNFLSAVRLNALLAPAMRDQGAGVIVHVSSAAVPAVPPPFLHYTAAKAALENYSRGLAAELAPHGIRVNTVSPGRTATPGGEATRKEWALLDPGPGQAANTPPLGREGAPDDIADAVLFLVSDRAGWLTGTNMVVDGGEFSRP